MKYSQCNNFKYIIAFTLYVKVFFHIKTIQYNHTAVVCSVPKCCFIELLIIGPSCIAHDVESFPAVGRKQISQRYGSLPLRCGTEPRRIYN